jgi:hypothetical protein
MARKRPIAWVIPRQDGQRCREVFALGCQPIGEYFPSFMNALTFLKRSSATLSHTSRVGSVPLLIGLDLEVAPVLL